MQNAQDTPPNIYSTAQIIEALKACDGLVSPAATRLGCEPSTIYRRIKHVDSVRQTIIECRSAFVDLAEQKLKEAVQAREPWAVTLVVKTLGKDRGYVERQELAGSDGKEITFRVTYGDPGESRDSHPTPPATPQTS